MGPVMNSIGPSPRTKLARDETTASEYSPVEFHRSARVDFDRVAPALNIKTHPWRYRDHFTTDSESYRPVEGESATARPNGV